MQPTGLLYRPLWTFQLWPPDAPAPTEALRTLAAEFGTYGRGNKDREFCLMPTSTVHLCCKSATWDPRLYFPSEGRRAEDFSARKNPTASAGFEPANLGTRGQHANP
jgi:hypothetical protein